MIAEIHYIVEAKDFEAFWAELERDFPTCRLNRSKREYLLEILQYGYGLVVAGSFGGSFRLNTTCGRVKYICEKGRDLEWL